MSRVCRAVWNFSFLFWEGHEGDPDLANQLVLTFSKKMADWIMTTKSTYGVWEGELILTVCICREIHSAEIIWMSSLMMPMSCSSHTAMRWDGDNIWWLPLYLPRSLYDHWFIWRKHINYLPCDSPRKRAWVKHHIYLQKLPNMQMLFLNVRSPNRCITVRPFQFQGNVWLPQVAQFLLSCVVTAISHQSHIKLL